MYLQSTSPWMFFSYKTSKGKNKDFARPNKFTAMPIPMPTLMLMQYKTNKQNKTGPANLQNEVANCLFNCCTLRVVKEKVRCGIRGIIASR